MRNRKLEKKAPDAGGHLDQRFQVRIPDDVYQQLIKMAERMELSQTEAIGRAISCYVEPVRMREITHHSGQLVREVGELLALVHSRQGFRSHELEDVVKRIDKESKAIIRVMKRKAD